MRQTLAWCVAAVLLAGATRASAAIYYVSPQGSDSADGLSPQHPWRSCQKLLQTRFEPGDTILFQRGGQWRERLQASSSGAAARPITYDAYGQGPKPRFWGSDVLPNNDFHPIGGNRFSCRMPIKADSALVNHVFLPSSWSDGTLTITTDGHDPRSDGRLYTACTRGNMLFSDRKSHLVFRNLVVDETAAQLSEGPNQGYGVRIEGSTDVLVENCEAYRCGRHNFAAINSTDFIGRHLLAAYVVPNMPGDNTPYVSYADQGAPVQHCVTTWDDISASHMEDGHGGQSILFVSHGDHLGLLTVMNSTTSTKISFMSAPVVARHLTLRDNASIENFGQGIVIDGVKLLGSSAIDQYGSGGTIQNCAADLTPTGGGPTGYGTAILCREKSRQNIIRFNTLVTGRFSGICLAGADSACSWYGNIFDAPAATVAKPAGKLTSADVALADDNFYRPTASVGGQTVEQWIGQGHHHSRSGDPGFVNAAKGDLHLRPGSPCERAAAVKADQIPPTDFAGTPRPPGPQDMGAFTATPR